MTQSSATEYSVHTRSTDTFGRVLARARTQHFVVDGPVSNGCPGEAVTPAELFLSGVASCGVELLQVLARAREVPLRGVQVDVVGVVDRSRPVRDDVTLFNSVRLLMALDGVDERQAEELVASFKAR